MTNYLNMTAYHNSFADTSYEVYYSKLIPFYSFITIKSFRLYEKLKTIDSSSVQAGSVAFATETSNVLIIWKYR